MIRTLCLSLAGFVLCASAHADLIWDNFITQIAGYDNVTARSSERNSIITDSWTGDDAVFAQPVQVQALEWIGFRSPGVVFPTADVVLLNQDFSEIALFQNLAYNANIMTTRTF